MSDKARSPRLALAALLGAVLLMLPARSRADEKAAAAPDPAPSATNPAPPQNDGASPLPAPRPGSGRIYTLDARERGILHDALSGGRTYKARIQAALLLGRRGNPEDDLRILERALADDDHYAVRGASAMAIGNLHDAMGIAPLLAGLGDEDSFVRRACRKALSQLSGPRAIPYLLLAREQPAGTARMVAVELLGGMDAPDAHHALTSFLGDPEAAVRDAVERAIKAWPREDQVSAVLDALGSDSYRVRTHAARLAGPLQDGRVLMPLSTLIASPLEPEEVLASAEASLSEMGALIDVDDHVKRVLGLVDRDARIPSVILLGFAGDERSVDVLRRAAADSDLRIRFYAVQALGRTGDRGSRKLLEQMALDPKNVRIKSAIRIALRTLGS